MPETILFSPGGASENTLAAILTELATKLDEGGTVSLSPATLAALEQVTVTLANTTVALDAPTLAALEQVTATIANLPADYPNAAVAALLTTIRDRTPILSAGRVPVSIEGGTVNVSASFTSFVSAVNSRDTNFAANEVWWGEWEDVRDYSGITVYVNTSHASAAPGGAMVQFSDDQTGINPTTRGTFIPGGVPLGYSFRPTARYVRFGYANGSDATTYFRSEVSYHFNPPALPELPLAYSSTDIDSGVSTKAHLAGRHASGQWVSLAADALGNLQVAGTVAVSNLPTPQTDALTDTQLRASAVPVTGPLTDAQLRASRVPVDVEIDQPLTDTQLRASAVPVSLATTPALTDAQLRATPVVVRDPIGYYATAAGGRVAFNITTGLLSIAATGEQLLAALVNPSGSGADIYLDVGEFGSSNNATFRRYRNSTITPTGTAVQAVNMSGGTASTPAVMYVGGATPTFTRTGGTVSKTAHIASFQQYVTELKGKAVLRPGQSLSWTITNSSGSVVNFTASVFFEFWSLPAAA